MDKAEDCRLNPKERYRLDGAFNLSSYDDDLRDYREYFDENGWPLFGDYDPYALKHPITGVSWLDEPRIPTQAEDDPLYESWYHLAEEFNTLLVSLWEARILPRRLLPERNKQVDVVYKIGTTRTNNAAENVTYLQRWILPRLGSLLRERTAGPELTRLWGEFRAIVEGLAIAMDREHEWRAQGKAGAKSQKKAQLKFYLHFIRRLSEEGGLSVRAANRELLNLVLGIINETLQAPPGFEDKEWWRAFLHTPQTDAAGRVKARGRTGKLAETFVRAHTNPHREKLLASSPHENPEIPPLELETYRRID